MAKKDKKSEDTSATQPAVESAAAPPTGPSFGSRLMTFNRILAACIVFQSITYKYVGRLGLERAPEKVFHSFDEFYPFYLSQHADATCQRLHVIGTSVIIALSLLTGSPILNYVTAMAPAMFIGCAGCALTSSMSLGVIEAVMMFSTFLYTVRATSRGWSKVQFAIVLILIGYAFAWVGHFYFEMNKPATFIYPTYSLMGDFRLWFEVVSNQRAW